MLASGMAGQVGVDTGTMAVVDIAPERAADGSVGLLSSAGVHGGGTCGSQLVRSERKAVVLAG